MGVPARGVFLGDEADNFGLGKPLVLIEEDLRAIKAVLQARQKRKPLVLSYCVYESDGWGGDEGEGQQGHESDEGLELQALYAEAGRRACSLQLSTIHKGAAAMNMSVLSFEAS